MNNKHWLFALLLSTSIAHGQGILVMVADELKQDISPNTLIPPSYQGTTIKRIVNIEEAFDSSEELNSPKNVRTLQKYIHEVDHDVLLDGVVLVGDFPMPTLHFTDEPAYIETTESTGMANTIRCSPSRASVMSSRAKSVRDTQAVLEHYRRIRDAVYHGQNTNEGLANAVVASDIEMAKRIRKQHPSINSNLVQDSFWISRITVKGDGKNNTWDLTQHQSGAKPSYGRRLSSHGKNLWGRKLPISGTVNHRVIRDLHRNFFSNESTEKSDMPIAYEYSFGASSPHYRSLTSHSRILDYPGVKPAFFNAGVSVLHTSESKAISEHLRASLLVISWSHEGNDQMVTPEERFKLASDWWFTSGYAKNAIFSASPVSHDFLGDALALLEESDYKNVGDYFLALQKRLRLKNKSKALNNLILFGNGLTPMPKLDLTTINKSALTSLYPDAFNLIEDTKVAAEQGSQIEEEEEEVDEQVNNIPQDIYQGKSATGGYSHTIQTVVNLAIMAGFVLLQRQGNAAAQAHNQY